MERIRIEGGAHLRGRIKVQGSKNAALPVMAAAVLVPGRTQLAGCPRISDVMCMCELLKSIGVKTQWQEDRLLIDASAITDCRLPKEHVRRMRSSVIVMGAMLGRCRRIRLYQPGGCVIGDRPIDMHLAALGSLGVSFREEGDELWAQAGRLSGARVHLPFPSVGATENVILGAVLAEGTTVIEGCAREPEIAALCDFLNGAGARISGGGTGRICVEGVRALHESAYRVEADRIVAGTYLIAGAAAGGDIFLERAPGRQLESLTGLLRRMGAEVTEEAGGLHIRSDGRMRGIDLVETGVYPAFPTDLQSPLLAALCQAEGESCVRETIFNGRLAAAEELNRMGGRIRVRGQEAHMEGGARLSGTAVRAQELRGGAALVLAGLCAEGTTRVENRHFIDRGYEDIVRDLRGVGAKIGSET